VVANVSGALGVSSPASKAGPDGGAVTMTSGVSTGAVVHRRNREQRPRHRLALLGIAVGLLAVAGIGIASAAHLTVTSANLYVTSASRCTNATLSVHVSPTGFSFGQNKSAVQITNFPAACFGRTTQVAVSNAAGALIASGSATCSAATCTIATGSYTAPSATGAHVLVSTWGVPASWDSTCTVIFIFMTCT